MLMLTRDEYKIQIAFYNKKIKAILSDMWYFGLWYALIGCIVACFLLPNPFNEKNLQHFSNVLKESEISIGTDKAHLISIEKNKVYYTLGKSEIIQKEELPYFLNMINEKNNIREINDLIAKSQKNDMKIIVFLGVFSFIFGGIKSYKKNFSHLKYLIKQKKYLQEYYKNIQKQAFNLY